MFFFCFRKITKRAALIKLQEDRERITFKIIIYLSFKAISNIYRIPSLFILVIIFRKKK